MNSATLINDMIPTPLYADRCLVLVVDIQEKLLPVIERELTKHALQETQGNQVKAASLLGITRATLRKRIERFSIRREVTVD